MGSDFFEPTISYIMHFAAQHDAQTYQVAASTRHLCVVARKANLRYLPG
jgi:hypothetical protein